MARIFWPMGVPPGSALSSTTRPLARKRAAKSRAWVDLPLPSGPSNVMKRPPRLVASVINEVEDFLQIVPRFALGVLVVGPQQIRGMIGDHNGEIAPLVPLAAQAHDAVLGG